MHLASGGYVAHMTSPSTSDVPFTATPEGIVYGGMFYGYDHDTDTYKRPPSSVVAFGPAPERAYVSTNPNTAGTYESKP